MPKNIHIGDVWDSEAMDTRLTGERYRIYINTDYVGDKMGLNAGEGEAVEDFLKSLGFSGYTMEYDNKNIRIKTDDKDLAEKLRNHLQEYLDLR
ncbi:MAG: hypothetical protein PWP48_1577 [Clostridiales bacterium]|jgi:phosphoribosylformylglycinamidine (FGAM) synthase PurS component|nr:hypothetical protein [Clostridiales bacterium]MDK2992344.1 hypothetical protein [Clostridiales bacterium]